MPWELHVKDTPRKGRVLVVDDEKPNRDVLRIALIKAGYDVVEAENGEKAAEMMRQVDQPLMVDVITCDIRIPKANGMDAIECFRQQFPSVPVVVITGFPETEMSVSLLNQGAVDYVPKPVEGEKLVAMIEKAMEQRIALKG